MHLNPSPLQELDLSFYGIDNKVYIKRDDLIHNIISGNKWRKLKYNLLHFKNLNKKGIISMGGAYSSHILALAYLCKEYSIPCVLLVKQDLHFLILVGEHASSTIQGVGLLMKMDKNIQVKPQFLKINLVNL